MTEVSASVGFGGFLFGVFCAYWAQTTDRNPWLWFVFGWVLPPLAGLMLLWKNAGDRPIRPNLATRGREELLAIRKDVP